MGKERGDQDSELAIRIVLGRGPVIEVGIGFRYFRWFLPARRYASAGLCDSDVSVRPSVRPSVTRRYCA